MSRIFFDDISNLEVVDLTGSKTQEQIRDEYKLSQLPIFLDINEKIEGYKRSGNFIVKTNLAAERAAKQAKIRARLDPIRTAIKTKLGLTDRQLDDLIILARNEAK